MHQRAGLGDARRTDRPPDHLGRVGYVDRGQQVGGVGVQRPAVAGADLEQPRLVRLGVHGGHRGDRQPAKASAAQARR